MSEQSDATKAPAQIPSWQLFLGRPQPDDRPPVVKLSLPEFFGPKFVYIFGYILVALLANPLNWWNVQWFCSYTPQPVGVDVFKPNPTIKSCYFIEMHPDRKCMQSYLGHIWYYQSLGYAAVALIVVAGISWGLSLKVQNDPRKFLGANLFILIMLLISAVFAQVVNGGFSYASAVTWISQDCPQLQFIFGINVEKPCSLMGSLFSAIVALLFSRVQMTALAFRDWRNQEKAKPKPELASVSTTLSHPLMNNQQPPVHYAPQPMMAAPPSPVPAAQPRPVFAVAPMVQGAQGVPVQYQPVAYQPFAGVQAVQYQPVASPAPPSPSYAPRYNQ